MTSDRPYRARDGTSARAFAELQAGAGARFDPECVGCVSSHPAEGGGLTGKGGRRAAISTEGGCGTISRHELDRERKKLQPPIPPCPGSRTLWPARSSAPSRSRQPADPRRNTLVQRTGDEPVLGPRHHGCLPHWDDPQQPWTTPSTIDSFGPLPVKRPASVTDPALPLVRETRAAGTGCTPSAGTPRSTTGLPPAKSGIACDTRRPECGHRLPCP